MHLNWLDFVFIILTIVALGRFMVSLATARRMLTGKFFRSDLTRMFYPEGVDADNFRIVATSLVPLWRKVFYRLFGFDMGFAHAMENTGLVGRGFHILQLGLTFAAVNTITATEQSMVVPTLPVQIPLGQALVFGNRLGAPQAGICIAHCRIIDSTHIGVTWVNPTAGGVTPTAAENFSFAIFW